MKIQKRKLSVVRKAIISLVLLASSTSVLAEHKRHTDYARVTDVQEIYKTVSHRVPVEQCHIERKKSKHRHHRHSAAATLIGSLAGARIGHKMDHHNRAGTVAGAIIGASIGNSIGRKHDKRHSRTEYRDVERCETHYETQIEEQLVGYRVAYKYHGSEYRTRMDRHPGRRIKVIVSVKPA